jgi:hypothetical protein
LPYGLAAFLGTVFLTALLVWRVAPKWLGNFRVVGVVVFPR